MEGGEPGGMQGFTAGGGLGALAAIQAVPLSSIAGQPAARQAPTLWSTPPGVGGGVGALVQQAPPISITPYTAPSWPWGKVLVAVLASGAVIYGAYRVASWWERR